MEIETEAPAPEAEEQTLAPETQAEDTGEQPQASPEEEQQQKPEKKDRLQLRFSDLTRQRDAATQEADYWRQEALRQQRSQPTQPEYNPLDPSIYPQGEQDPAYIDALVDQRVNQALERRQEETARQTAQTEAANRAIGLRDKLLESGLEGAITLATSDAVRVSPAMIEALAVSENAALVADHLGRTPAEASRIANLPPSVQGFELARLEARLASQPKPIPSAKAPTPTVSGQRAAVQQGLRDDMPIDEWMAQEAKRRRG